MGTSRTTNQKTLKYYHMENTVKSPTGSEGTSGDISYLSLMNSEAKEARSRNELASVNPEELLRVLSEHSELLEALSIIANALSPNSLPVNGMMASYDHALMVREEADRAFEVARAAIAKATQP